MFFRRGGFVFFGGALLARGAIFGCQGLLRRFPWASAGFA
jgi:hypothetical protein